MRLSPAILRVAGWPIETIESLRSPALIERIDNWIRDDDVVRREGEVLAAELYALVPRLDERRVRGLVLELKRCLLRSADPPLGQLMSSVLENNSIVETLGQPLRAMQERRTIHMAERADIEQAHRVEMERAGDALEKITNSDAFLRALSVASLSTFARWEQAQDTGTGRRSRLRLQRTLHRYLMRAVGRATPNGLWSGVALEDMAEERNGPIEVRPARAVVRVRPALSLLSRALNGINRHEPWINEVFWRRNPTLRRIDTDMWEFGAFADGAWCVRRIAGHPQLDLLAEHGLPNDRARLGEIEQMLRSIDPQMSSAFARELINVWISAGVIWSTAAFPALFSDPWNALDATIEALPTSEQPIWRECRATLAQIAAVIEETGSCFDPWKLRDLLQRAKAVARTLLRRYQAALSDDENVLIVDCSAPFEFSISREMIDAIERNLRAYWYFDRFGLGELETRMAIREFLGNELSGSRARLGDYLTRGAEIDLQGSRSWQERVLSKANSVEARCARQAFDRWDREIRPSLDGRVHQLPANETSLAGPAMPAGSALLLIGDLNGEAIIRIGGLTPEPCFFYSRFAHVLGRGDGELDVFRNWQSTTTNEILAANPVLQFADLAVRNQNINAAARPRFACDAIDPLDGTSGLLSDVVIGRNQQGHPVICSPGERLLLPWARSAALLAGLDRFASVLAAVSILLGRPSLMTPIPRLDQEIAEWHHMPRLVLKEAVISPERWTPQATTGAALADAVGAERLIVWRRFVRQAGLPDLIYTFVGKHQTESLLAADSAIGVEFLGQELRAQGPAFRAQELFPGPDAFFVRDREGRRYLAELAVAWPGDKAFWQDYSGSRASDA